MIQVKIGVALSGCGIGGIAAYSVLQELEKQGMEIVMVSASGVPSLTAAMFAYGYSPQHYLKAADAFLNDARLHDLDTAIDQLADTMSRFYTRKNIPLAINAVHIPDESIVTFTNDFALNSQRLHTQKFLSFYDAFSATISHVDGLGHYRYKDYRLCDFSAKYGCPLYPLKMTGIKKILSFAFLSNRPQTAFEMMSKQVIQNTSGSASLHFNITASCYEVLPTYMEEAKKVAERAVDVLCFDPALMPIS